jgi:hypothetical protein
MRFLPFGDASIDSEPTVQAAEDLCRRVREILPYTYLFNTPGTPYLHTTCPRCGALLMYREFFGPMGSRMIASAPEGRCPCGHRVPIKGPVRKKAYEEFGMSGGYRYTRGLEIIKSLCECLGIVSDEEIDRVWCSVVEQDDVGKLHDKINRVDTYLALITEMGQRFGKEARASTLTDYMAERIGAVATAVRGGSRPSVYYAMGTPLFALNAERFEVHLVELAGGYCVNTNITRSGKPGVNLSREELLDMNPEHIFISGLFSSAEEAFRETCSKNGIWVDAVRDHRIHAVSPGWDFGNPRWILGLMQIANILHPETSTFDLAAETERFYRVFHHAAPDRFISNRSFYQQPMPSQREPGHGPAPSEGVPA